MEGSALLEILKKESPFFIADIVEKYNIPRYKVDNVIRYHYFEFKKKKVPRKDRGRPRILYTYVGKRVRYDK